MDFNSGLVLFYRMYSYNRSSVAGEKICSLSANKYVISRPLLMYNQHQPLKFLSSHGSGKIFDAIDWPSTMAECCFTGCTVITGVV